MPEKYTLKNISGRDLVFVRPVNLRFKTDEEKVVFLSDPQADAFRQNPGEVELVKVKADLGEKLAAQFLEDQEKRVLEKVEELSSEVEKEEPPEPEGGGKKKGRR